MEMETKDKSIDRLEFLANKFDVFEATKESIDLKIANLSNDDKYSVISSDDEILAFVKYGIGDEKSKEISVALNVFAAIIGADPTSNKSCVQWMLTVFVRHIKIGKSESAIRFVVEDLPLVNEYIKLFEGNKRKAKFKEFCKHSFILKDVEDPTDINQYKSLSQLFDAVDPFIKKDPSDMENMLNRFVSMGQAVIPVKDRKFTLFIPKSVEASVAFSPFANWCTTRPGNGMFDSYTNYKRPDGRKSDLYIIINNKFFTNESKDVYQIHFESNQIKDRSNGNNVSIFEEVISESEGLSNFFYEELMGMAKLCKTGIDNNEYLDYLIKFGFCESLFEFMDTSTAVIKFTTREIPRLPDISRFKNLEELVIVKAKLVELHPSIGDLTKLEMLSLTENSLKTLPKEIGKLKNLGFLNIKGNKITSFPEEIKYLDRVNGGSCFRVSVNREEIGEELYLKLKGLLPTTRLD